MINNLTIFNFLTKEECELLLNFSLTNDLKKAEINKGNGAEVSKVRDSNIFMYDYTLEFPFLKEKLINTFKKEVNIKGFDIDFTNNLFQFTEYKTNGHYDWHVDSTSTIFPDRFCSMVIQLNDEYIGGDLQIKEFNGNEITLKRGTGNLFIFYSHMTHRVTQVESGVRYSLVNWFKMTPKENFKKTLI